MADDRSETKHLAATHMMHALEPLGSAIEARLRRETGSHLIDSEALRVIDTAGQPLRMTDIAVRLVVSKAGATKVIDRLEKQGFVRRTQDQNDRRSYLVAVTTDGRAALARHRPVVDAAIEAMWSRHLSAAEARTVLELADRLIAANPDWYDR